MRGTCTFRFDAAEPLSNNRLYKEILYIIHVHIPLTESRQSRPDRKRFLRLCGSPHPPSARGRREIGGCSFFAGLGGLAICGTANRVKSPDSTAKKELPPIRPEAVTWAKNALKTASLTACLFGGDPKIRLSFPAYTGTTYHNDGKVFPLPRPLFEFRFYVSACWHL